MASAGRAEIRLPEHHDREAHKPSVPVLAPLRSRHALGALRRNSWIRERTTIALEGVDMVEDTRLIREGWGVRHPSSHGTPEMFEINDRWYGIEGTPQVNGAYRLYPVRGEGCVQLSRIEFKTLILLIQFDGLTLECEKQFVHDPQITSETIETALRVYRLRRNR